MSLILFHLLSANIYKIGLIFIQERGIIYVKVYLATPLNNNRDIEKSQLLSNALTEINLEIISKWVTWNDPNPNLNSKQIFQRDINAIEESDILIAEVSSPSIGVGMEIMYAHFLHKPILCAHTSDTISNMVKGMPHCTVIKYSDFNDLKKENFVNFRSKD